MKAADLSSNPSLL